MYVGKFLEYISYEKRYSTNTVTSYRHDLNEFHTHLKSLDHTGDFLKASRQEIRSFIVSLSKKNLSNRSINRKLATLKSFYRYLQKIDALSIHPLQEISSLKAKQEIQVPFSVKEMNLLLSDSSRFPDTFVGQRDRLIIELLYATGMRKSELTQLRLTDIDVNNESVKVMGKRRRERIIPIRASLVKEILAYISQRKQIATPSNNYLFVTEKGKKIYEKLVYHVVNAYLGLISSRLKRSPHMLRHTFASHLLDHGADLNAIKELLGHSTLASTQIYIHTSLKRLKSVYSKAHPRETQNH